MKSLLLSTFFTIIFFLPFSMVSGQDLISGGSNSWIFHTPDDGRTNLYMAPMIDGTWAWSKQHIFSNNGSVKFGGNLGVGMSPHSVEKLSVGGTSRLGSEGLGGGIARNGILVQTNGTRTELRWQHFGQSKNPYLAVDPGVNSTQLIFGTNGSDRMWLSSQGSLGIGTSTPEASLDVNGDIQLRYGYDIKASGKTIISTGWLNNQDYISLHVPGNGGNGQRKFLIKHDGNVGIGLDNPQFKLDINGDVRIKYGGKLFAGTGTNRTVISTGWDGIGQDFTSFHVAGNTGDGSPKLTIRSDGNIGIGTTAPDAPLTVAGNVHAREIKVTATAGGADFVFADDYSLPKLEAVATFVKQNKHLPEIPSAAEMEANGLHLAEMNIKLLQKVEELTLYAIEQEKKLAAQEQKAAERDQLIQQLMERMEKLEKNRKN